MANKQVFTAFDVYGLKKALALWAAKNNALIEKYEKFLKIVKIDESELYDMPPSPSRDASLYSISHRKRCYEMILDDLRTPCDLFVSKFEENERR